MKLMHMFLTVTLFGNHCPSPHVDITDIFHLELIYYIDVNKFRGGVFKKHVNDNFITLNTIRQ